MNQEITDQTTELKALAPAGTFVEKVTVKSYHRSEDREVVNEHTYYLRQFGYLKFFKVLGHTQTIYAAIKALNIDLDGLLKGFENNPLSIVEPILKISSLVGEDVAQLTALAIDKPVEYLDTLDPDDGLKLTIGVFKVNADFFVQRILPQLETMKTEAEVAATLAAVGPTS